MTQFIAMFIAGMLTIFLPCILPLVPIVLGVSVTDRHPLRPVMTISGMLISFVGFTFLLQVVLNQFVEAADYLRIGTYYVLLLFGFGFLFHKKWQLWAGAVAGSLFFIDKGWIGVAGALLFGLVAVEVGGRVASRLQSIGADLQNKTREKFGSQSLLSAFLIGLTLGLVWVPCAGPALGFALSLIREEPGLYALALLATYGLGTAIPLAIVGYGGQKFVHSFRSAGKFSNRIKQVAGVFLILTAIALQYNLFIWLQTQLAMSFDVGSFASRIEESLFPNQVPPEPEPSAEPIDTNALPVLGTAPELNSDGPWHNSEPLNLADLRGKVVLVDFWTYSCINCIRTLPYLRQYWDKYKDQPFVLLGVHTPEFVFEKSESNVADALERYDLTYPVVQDNDFGTWRAFKNRYWPAKYLIDAEGNIRYQHFGEGKYEETDEAIASLLAEIGADTSGPDIVTDTSGERREKTPETYLHSRSWEALQNKQGEPTDAVISYEAPAELEKNAYALDGDWQLADDERQVLRSDTGEILLHFTGAEANLVMGLENGATPVEVTVEIDGTETGTFTVDRSDLYPLFDGEYGDHKLRLMLSAPGVAGYAFTFGDR